MIYIGPMIIQLLQQHLVRQQLLAPRHRLQHRLRLLAALLLRRAQLQLRSRQLQPRVQQLLLLLQQRLIQ